MALFHALDVTEITKTTRDAVVVSLRPEGSGDFSFIPGQYLTFRHEIDGVELRRSYSICAGIEDGQLQVGIKRVEGGAFSSWANTVLQPGMQLEAMEPMGKFHTPLDAGHHKFYLGFAGGSGITPVLSIIKSVLAKEAFSRFTLIYANRGVSSIMFREELEALKNLYMNRFSVVHILESDAQDIDLFQGRVDEEKCAQLFAGWVDIGAVDAAFICGPEPMMLGIAKALRAHGLRDEQIKYELFASSQPGRLPQKAQNAAAAGAAATFSATITLDGATRTVDISPQTAVLDAALAASLDVPYACKAGVCSTCKCKVLEGQVEMAANHALEDYEVAQGYILSCQAYPITPKLRVDYDQ